MPEVLEPLAPDLPLPQTGGAFVRNPDGSLAPDPTEAPPPAEPE